MIVARGLSFSYGASPVLRDVSFRLEPGGLTALLGCNGAGKTTLFRCLLGLLTRYEGALELDGMEPKRCTAARMARSVAYIPQTDSPAFSYTALDMVLMGVTRQLRPFASPGEAQRRCALEAMERLGVVGLAERDFVRLSGGEKQLVLIARALAQRTRILLMDEPTASLDYGNQLRVLRQMRALSREGYTVLTSTHNPQHALDYADRVLALHEGALVADGAPTAVLTEALMWTLYGVEARFFDTPGGRVIVPECDR